MHEEGRGWGGLPGMGQGRGTALKNMSRCFSPEAAKSRGGVLGVTGDLLCVIERSLRHRSGK